MAGILKYFRCTNNSSCKDSDKEESSLPDPNGVLSEKIPSSSITVANTMVNEILEKPCGKRGAYLALTPAQKFSVGKCAAESDITGMICYHAKTFPEGNISTKDKE